MIDYSRYPHLPTSIKRMLREFDEITQDETVHPNLRRFFAEKRTELLEAAQEIEDIASDAESQGYSTGLNQGYNAS